MYILFYSNIHHLPITYSDIQKHLYFLEKISSYSCKFQK